MRDQIALYTAPVLTEDRSIATIAQLELASADLRAIAGWVASKRNSDHTRRAFRTEAQRWLAWVIWAKQDTVLSSCGSGNVTWLDKTQSIDASVYTRFLMSEKPTPFPSEVLRAAGLDHQPFKPGPLATTSVERAIDVLKTMYGDMVEMVLDDGFEIRRSPFARFKTSSMVSGKSSRSKALTAAERKFVDVALEKLKNDGAIPAYHQYRWIWNALKWSAMRRSELAAARAGHIFQDADEEGEIVWKIGIIGKGKTEKNIPLSDRFMDEFKVYRDYHGLPAIPMPGIDGKSEETPLVVPIKGVMRAVSDMLIYRAMKHLFALAADESISAGNPACAARLRSFASHSARHTCITMIIDATGDITLGQDIARHASIATTRQYKAESVSRLKKALNNLKDM